MSLVPPNSESGSGVPWPVLHASDSVTAPVPLLTHPTTMSELVIVPSGLKPTPTQPVTLARSVKLIDVAVHVHDARYTPSGDVYDRDAPGAAVGGGVVGPDVPVGAAVVGAAVVGAAVVGAPVTVGAAVTLVSISAISGDAPYTVCCGYA